jgi:transposase
VAIAMEIYEKIRYYHEHTDYSQRKVAQMLGVSRNTVKKYWEGQTVPWDRKPGSGRKNDVITDEVRIFIISCLEADKTAPKKQRHTARRIYERLVSELGFEGCEASVRRAVVELRGRIRKDSYQFDDMCAKFNDMIEAEFPKSYISDLWLGDDDEWKTGNSLYGGFSDYYDGTNFVEMIKKNGKSFICFSSIPA